MAKNGHSLRSPCKEFRSIKIDKIQRQSKKNVIQIKIVLFIEKSRLKMNLNYYKSLFQLQSNTK